MSNGLAISQYAQGVLESGSPEKALEIVKTELQRAEAQAEIDRIAAKENASVVFRDDGTIQSANLGGIQRLGAMYAGSSLVPGHFQGNIANCSIGVQLAIRLKMDVMTVLQGIYIVKGRTGFEAKFGIALLNASGNIKGRVRFNLTGEGKTRQCEASATDKETGDTYIQTVTMKMAESEGWTKNPKWQTLPDLMLQYRSAMFLIRLHFPEVLMGMQSKEELDDIAGVESFATGDAVPTADLDVIAEELMPTKPKEEERDESGELLPNF